MIDGPVRPLQQTHYLNTSFKTSSAMDQRKCGMNDRLNLIHRWEPQLRCRASNAPLRRVKRFTMGAVFLSAALSMLTSAASSQGTEGTPEQQEACTPDAMKLCGASIPDARRVEECLIQRIAVLSLRCREVIEKGRRSDSRSPSGSPHRSN